MQTHEIQCTQPTSATDRLIVKTDRFILLMENNSDYKEKEKEREVKKDSVIPEFSIEYKRDM